MALKKVAKKRVAKKTGVKKTIVRKTGVKAPVKKRVAKKTAPAQSPISMLEKELSTLQIKLAKANEREALQREKNLAKLKAQLERAVSKQTLLKEKKAAASKSQAEKSTQAAKTRVARANAALKANNVIIKGIRAELQSSKSAHDETRTAQKKSVAMEKLVAKFERDWQKAASKTRKIVRRSRKPAAAKEVKPSSESAVVESTND